MTIKCLEKANLMLNELDFKLELASLVNPDDDQQ